jgi:predicted nucleic acid-binding protein
VVDTSALIAVLTGEEARDRLIARTQGTVLVAPASVHWELGNALAALVKRRRLTLAQARVALDTYAGIPLRIVEVDLAVALELADRFGLYAHDAYLVACARSQQAALLTVDPRLARTAREAGVQVVEV